MTTISYANEVTPKKIGQRIREARTSAGLTQTQLSEVVGISSVGVARWEMGGVVPSLDRIVAVADALGVDARELAFGREITT